jgi:hypothetical protein
MIQSASDFGDLLKYRYRRAQEMSQEGGEAMALRGLLISNHHSGREPERRPKPYEGNSDILGQAKEMDIGLLSTYDLFLLVQRVDAGELSKEHARELIKQAGIIDGNTTPP